KRRDSSGERHTQADAIDVEGLVRDSLTELLRQSQAAGQARARQQERELVTSDPRHEVNLPGAVDHATGDFDEGAVAGLVAVNVVDCLEAVEVGEDEGERLRDPPRARDLL